MSDFLKEMATASRARAEAAKRTFTSAELERTVHPLRLSGFDLIAEIKDRSPAEGELVTSVGNRCDRALSYVDGGAAAISVLTEPERFDGALSHLEEVVTAVSSSSTPVMRKDFLVDPIQILEAKAAGASGVLLIAAMLDDDALSNMLDCAYELDLFVLLESFDVTDFDRSVRLLQNARHGDQADRLKLLLGINTRDLRTLAVDPSRLAEFGSKLPQGVVCVAESGQHSANDAAKVAKQGYSMALVGTALMRAGQPAGLIGDMLSAGRSA
jgi:indole-3-glycerol phosphate synthase